MYILPKKPRQPKAHATEKPKPKHKPKPKPKVRIRAADGNQPPPKEIDPTGPVKLKGVPLPTTTGKYTWKTNSKRLKLTHENEQIVTVEVLPEPTGGAGSADAAKADGSATSAAPKPGSPVKGGDKGQTAPAKDEPGEEIELVFAPNGHAALAPVKHKLVIGKGVEIRAEDEGAPPPKALLGKAIKLKGVLKTDRQGTWNWSTKSERIRLTNADQQVVTVSPVGASAAGAGEVIELVFTPEGANNSPPAKHAIALEGTVAIKAEDGAGVPAPVIGVLSQLKLKAVPGGETGGTYAWKASSGLVKLTAADQQIVTIEAGNKTGQEELELVFTPEGGQALAPVKHAFRLATVSFAKDAGHRWGYDKTEQLPCKDKDYNSWSLDPSEKIDFMSIPKAETSTVTAKLDGLDPASVFFTSSSPDICAPVSAQPTSDPFTLTLRAGNQDVGQARIQARVGSASGPVAAEIGVVVLKPLAYEAEYFRVVDSTSPATALVNAGSGNEVSSVLDSIYSQGVASMRLVGGDREQNVRYDLIVNGAVDMEPGTVTEEQRRIIAACPSGRPRVVVVQDLRWRYVLAEDAQQGATQLRLVRYDSAYLTYLGQREYQLADAGGEVTVTLASAVDPVTGLVLLAAPLARGFSVVNQSALIFNLAGLSGDPIWIKDSLGSRDIVNKVIAHELGHQCAGWIDLVDVGALMHGVAEGGAGIRHRAIDWFYNSAREKKTEAQWTAMRGR